MSSTWKYVQYPEQEVHELSNRIRLRWNNYQDSTGVTQTAMSKQLGVSQGAFAQFLSGITPISNEMLMRMAKIMSFDVRNVVQGLNYYESFFRHVRFTNPVNRVFQLKDAVLTELSKEDSAVADVMVMSSHDDLVSLVELETNEYAPRFKHGHLLIIKKDDPIDGDELMVKLTNELFVIGEYSSDSHTITTMNADEETYNLYNVKEYFVITGTTRK